MTTTCPPRLRLEVERRPVAVFDSGDGNFKKGRFNPIAIIVGILVVAGLAAFLTIGLKQDAEKLTVEQAEAQKKAIFVLPKAEQIPKWRQVGVQRSQRRAEEPKR